MDKPIGLFLAGFVAALFFLMVTDVFREQPFGALHVLEACEKSHNVFKCEWVATPLTQPKDSI